MATTAAACKGMLVQLEEKAKAAKEKYEGCLAKMVRPAAGTSPELGPEPEQELDRGREPSKRPQSGIAATTMLP